MWEGPPCGLVASYERTGGIHGLHVREDDSTLKTETAGSPRIVFFSSYISILTFSSCFFFPFSLSVSTAEFPFPLYSSCISSCHIYHSFSPFRSLTFPSSSFSISSCNTRGTALTRGVTLKKHVLAHSVHLLYGLV